MQLVTIVMTRKVPLTKCGNPPVLGRKFVRLLTPFTAEATAEKLFPPSVDRVYLISDVPGTCQETWIVPSSPMASDGA